MKYAPFAELKTKRLVLRKMARRDAPLYFARLGGSEAVTRYMLFAPHSTVEDTVHKTERSQL